MPQSPTVSRPPRNLVECPVCGTAFRAAKILQHAQKCALETYDKPVNNAKASGSTFMNNNKRRSTGKSRASNKKHAASKTKLNVTAKQGRSNRKQGSSSQTRPKPPPKLGSIARDKDATPGMLRKRAREPCRTGRAMANITRATFLPEQVTWYVNHVVSKVARLRPVGQHNGACARLGDGPEMQTHSSTDSVETQTQSSSDDDDEGTQPMTCTKDAKPTVCGAPSQQQPSSIASPLTIQQPSSNASWRKLPNATIRQLNDMLTGRGSASLQDSHQFLNAIKEMDTKKNANGALYERVVRLIFSATIHPLDADHNARVLVDLAKCMVGFESLFLGLSKFLPSSFTTSYITALLLAVNRTIGCGIVESHQGLVNNTKIETLNDLLHKGILRQPAPNQHQ